MNDVKQIMSDKLNIINIAGFSAWATLENIISANVVIQQIATTIGVLALCAYNVYKLIDRIKESKERKDGKSTD
jgi:hypothetical protein